MAVESEERTENWVVGVDGSDEARHAATWALRHASCRSAALQLVTAWSVPSAPALPPIGPMRRYWDAASFERDAGAALERLADEMRRQASKCHAAPPIETRLEQGPASAVLLGASRSAALLVVGARGRGGFDRLVLGSTSTQCATHAGVPTAVIPAGAPIGPVARVLVAVDGSEQSLAALRWTFDFVGPDTTVECLSVWEVSPRAAVPDDPDAENVATDRLERLVGAVRESDAVSLHPSVTVTSRVEHGDPRTELASAAVDADLVVMGARGHRAIGAVLLGSVSTWLLHHVDRSMVVVP